MHHFMYLYYERYLQILVVLIVLLIPDYLIAHPDQIVQADLLSLFHLVVPEDLALLVLLETLMIQVFPVVQLGQGILMGPCCQHHQVVQLALVARIAHLDLFLLVYPVVP